MLTGHIEYKYTTNCVLQIGGDDTFEFLLTCSVPQLESTTTTFIFDIFAHEIYANRWLDNTENTLKKSSNRLLANFSMIQVFPTPLSPKNMILCVFLPSLELLEEDIFLVILLSYVKIIFKTKKLKIIKSDMINPES